MYENKNELSYLNINECLLSSSVLKADLKNCSFVLYRVDF